MFIFKSNMDKDFDQICEYILKLKRAELFLHGIKQQDKTKARLYHAMLEYYDANHKKERHMRILKYQKYADHTVENNGSIEDCVKKIISIIDVN